MPAAQDAEALALELAAARERLEAVTALVVGLRRKVRKPRRVRVPEITEDLHLIEAVASGKPARPRPPVESAT